MTRRRRTTAPCRRSGSACSTALVSVPPMAPVGSWRHREDESKARLGVLCYWYKESTTALPCPPPSVSTHLEPHKRLAAVAASYTGYHSQQAAQHPILLQGCRSVHGVAPKWLHILCVQWGKEDHLSRVWWGQCSAQWRVPLRRQHPHSALSPSNSWTSPSCSACFQGRDWKSGSLPAQPAPLPLPPLPSELAAGCAPPPRRPAGPGRLRCDLCGNRGAKRAAAFKQGAGAGAAGADGGRQRQGLAARRPRRAPARLGDAAGLRLLRRQGQGAAGCGGAPKVALRHRGLPRGELKLTDR